MRSPARFPRCLLLGVVLGAACLLVSQGCFYKSNYQSSQRTVRSSTGGAGDPGNQILLTYFDREGLAVLETELWTLEFAGLSDRQRSIFHFPGGGLTIQISGNATSTASVHARRNWVSLDFHSHYADGTNTVTLGKATFQLVDQGRTLVSGETRIASGEVRKRLRWTRAGRLSVW